MKKAYTAYIFFAIVFVLMLSFVGCQANGVFSLKEKNVDKGATDIISNVRDGNDAIVLKFYSDEKYYKQESVQKIISLFKEKTGIQVEPNILTGSGDDYNKKMEISLMSGDETDIIEANNPVDQYKYVKFDFLMPLDGVMKDDNFDADQVYGEFLTTVNGQVYYIPYHMSKWVIFYNKKIFDEAKVPYPKGPWTWSEYVETAKKLTNPEKGIYGAYTLDYDCYMYFIARQKNISGYKADGTSNFDHPAFKESLKLFGDFGNVHGIQPSWLEFKIKKMPWDGFMNGKYGMHFIGYWYAGLLTDYEAYPRDWNWGITQLPTPDDGSGNNNLFIVSNIGINKNSRYPKETFQFIKFFSEEIYKYRNLLPANAGITEEVKKGIFQNISDKTNGDVRVEDLYDALFTNRLGSVEEKIIGPAAIEYNEIILEEAESYLIGYKTLDEAIQSIKTRADEAINNEK